MACFVFCSSSPSILPVLSKFLIHPNRIRLMREGRLEEVRVQPIDAHEKKLTVHCRPDALNRQWVNSSSTKTSLVHHVLNQTHKHCNSESVNITSRISCLNHPCFFYFWTVMTLVTQHKKLHHQFFLDYLSFPTICIVSRSS